MVFVQYFLGFPQIQIVARSLLIGLQPINFPALEFRRTLFREAAHLCRGGFQTRPYMYQQPAAGKTASRFALALRWMLRARPEATVPGQGLLG